MLDRDTRTAILRLRAEGHGTRKIAKALGISRNTVKDVLRDGQGDVDGLQRDDLLGAHIELVRALYVRCKGNLQRVWEELATNDVEVGYSTLTAFCRRNQIGPSKKKRAGRYQFDPGEEMQHDTSPHRVEVGGKMRSVQCASLVLCFARMLFAQVYPTFNRFFCKVFLTAALRYLGGAAGRCIVDNTSVVRARGSGKDMVPADEMAAFSDHFGFDFVAHEAGHADRSARVERPFHFIENNFYAGRTFEDLADLNAQLVEWCDKVNHKYKPNLGFVPADRYAIERPMMKPLPIFIPEVYRDHPRRVGVQGYVWLHRNRYSAPTEAIGWDVTVRETLDRVRILAGHRLLAEHAAREPGAGKWVTLPEHLHQAGRRTPPPPSLQEQALRAAAPELAMLADALRKRHGGQAVRQMKHLHRMFLDYPTDALIAAVSRALTYGLADLERIERMVLRGIAGDFFKLPGRDDEDDHE